MTLKAEANKCKIDAGSPEAIRTVEERGGVGGGGRELDLETLFFKDCSLGSFRLV